MRTPARFSVAFLCSLVMLVVGLYCGSLLLLLFDSNYHDGFEFVGGLIIGLAMAVFIFRVVMKKLSNLA